MERSPLLGTLNRPDPCTLVLYGGRGDLASRKLLPALYGLWAGGYMPEQFALVGVGRREFTDEQYRSQIAEDLKEFRRPLPEKELQERFLAHAYYQPADFTRAEPMAALKKRLQALEQDRGLPGHRLYYFATDPRFFGSVIDVMAQTGFGEQPAASKTWARVIFEKPFGQDLASARILNQQLLTHLREEQIFRIDHYLGKETVQNLLAFRFGNAIFEPLFNRNYVDHVQITMAETVGMEGARGAYYDGSGALRDVLQNHLLQLLALIAMEPPSSLRADAVSAAKRKVLQELLPLSPNAVGRHVVRGQYGAGTEEEKAVPGYRQETGIRADSTTETFVALRADIGNWRWAGVPFLIRTGKRMPKRGTEVTVQFRLPPLSLFRTVECEDDFCDLADAQPNVLAFRIQPHEGIHVAFSAKHPGMRLDLQRVCLDFDYDHTFHQALPEAYERLLFDAMRGDATLFVRTDELEAEWAYVTPILDAWKNAPPPAYPNYAAGTWGPREADRLAAEIGAVWRNP